MPVACILKGENAVCKMFSDFKFLGFQPKEISELRVGLQICVTHSVLFFLPSGLHVCGGMYVYGCVRPHRKSV